MRTTAVKIVFFSHPFSKIALSRSSVRTTLETRFFCKPTWIEGFFFLRLHLSLPLYLGSIPLCCNFAWCLPFVGVISPSENMMKDTALKPADMTSIKSLASLWLRKHVGVDARKLPRTRRIWDAEARSAYTIITASSKGNDVAQPCIACGTWAVSWCESCDMVSPPQAICTECDAEGLTCRQCRADGKTYEQSKQQHAASSCGQTIEISGFQTDDGFVRLERPLHFDTSEVDIDVDGNIDMPKLMERIRSAMNSQPWSLSQSLELKLSKAYFWRWSINGRSTHQRENKPLLSDPSCFIFLLLLPLTHNPRHSRTKNLTNFQSRDLNLGFFFHRCSH